MPTIRAARAADLAAVVNLLDTAHLPHTDIGEAHLPDLLVLADDDGVYGSVAVERAGRVALLRSLAIADALRGQGWGQRLLDAGVAHARRHGIDTLYLLTTSAAPFFAARGWQAIARGQAPAALQTSAQFAALCPASATCMQFSIPTESNDD